MKKIDCASQLGTIKAGDIIVSSAARETEFRILKINESTVMATQVKKAGVLKIFSREKLMSDNWWLMDADTVEL